MFGKIPVKVKCISLQQSNFSPIDRKIDHIVYGVSNLDDAIDEFESKLGIRPILGGHHTHFGTKNALINLGDGLYFELLAADDKNQSHHLPRWMGIDYLTKNQIIRWAIKSKSLDCDRAHLVAYHPEMGRIEKGSRIVTDGTLLQWFLSMPLATPEVELAPFLLDWSTAEQHPSDLLPDMGCRLLRFYATHPNPKRFSPLFNALGVRFEVRPSDVIAIKAVIKCPNGILEL